MRLVSRIGVVAARAVVLSCLLPFFAAHASMATEGQLAVTPGGSATYTIPIEVPPGTAGMAPNLSLAYDSRSGNGLLGIGWSVGGLSAISRCPRTMPQDGVRGAVKYDNNDRFCLDGQRLIAIGSGAYGSSGMEYRTEIDGFTKIIANGIAGNGPSWFKVWTKSGQILEFGNTADSKIEVQGQSTVRAWAVNKIQDIKGNYFTFSYTEDSTNGDYYPSRIDYTGNAAASLVPNKSVQFIYEIRPDTALLYHGGAIVKNTKRMTHVQTYVGAQLVKDYVLSYATDATVPRSRITSIQECASGGQCLPALSLAWQNLSDSTFRTFNAFSSVVLGNSTATIGATLGDFNGDGKTDILRWSNDPSSNVLYLSNGDGTFNGLSVFNGILLSNNTSTLGSLVNDFNGDGKADVLRWSSDASANALYLSNGDGTFTTVGTLNGVLLGDSGMDVGAIDGDFNGDGKTDILRWSTTPASNRLYLSNGDGTFTSSNFFTPAALADTAGDIGTFVADFNGDGRTDILRWSSDASANILYLSNGDGTFTSANVFNGVLLGSSDHTIGSIIGDFNGDGKADILRWTDSGSSNVLYLSKGDGTFINSSVFSGVLLGNGTGTIGSFASDFNGDGKTDILRWTDSGTANVLYLANGDGTFTTVGVLNGVALGNSTKTLGAVIADYQGIGKADILRWSSDPTGNRLYLANGTPGNISSITTGTSTT